LGTGLGFVLLSPLCGCDPPSAPPAGPQPGRPLALAIRPAGDDPAQVRVLLEGAGAEKLRDHLAAPERGVEEVFYLAVAGQGKPVPVLASYEWDAAAGAAVLTPRVSLTPGLSYRAVFDGPGVEPSLPSLAAEYAVPKDESSSPSRVTAVYPNQREVPANLLKLYVHFSEPMAEGEVFRHVRLLDGAGRPVDQAFREVELWADDHRRLTLLINPGRTKRSLGLSESLGPVLEEKREYVLEIAPGLKDQKGRRISGRFTHPFRTTTPDREQPRIGEWGIRAPEPDTRRPLEVTFPEPMDRALALRVIEVTSPTGKPVEGKSELSGDGRQWTFAPGQPWQLGEHVLTAGGELEDLAGNSLLRPFETTPGSGPKPAAEPPVFRRSFTVTAAGL
jgi:hypothetical protein